MASWEADGSPDGSEGRISTICKAAGEVAPAVVTAVSTTVISFLPVFFLTGRDFRLFSPLAWTKTYALVASLIVAIMVVPVLSRIFLTSGKQKRWMGMLVGGVFGLILGLLAAFVWRVQIDKLFSISSIMVAAIIGLVGGLAVFWMMRERVRPIDSNPVSRFVNYLYEPTLRLFLRYKKSFLALPALIVFLGAGAWVGLPKILYPFEQAAKWVGADFNELDDYVDLKHQLTGLSSDDWIALDEGSWFYMPSLYPAASLSQAHGSSANAGHDD